MSKQQNDLEAVVRHLSESFASDVILAARGQLLFDPPKMRELVLCFRT